MAGTAYKDIKDSLIQLYAKDERPWLVGFSWGKDSTMLASLIFDAVLFVPQAERKKPISVLCTDTRIEIPAIAEMVEGTLSRMQRFSRQNELNIEVNLLKPPPEQSFWVNIIGRGVARIINQQRGIIMNANLTELNRLRELEEEVAREFGVRADILRRMLAKVEEYSESHRAHGLPDDLLNALKDDLSWR